MSILYVGFIWTLQGHTTHATQTQHKPTNLWIDLELIYINKYWSKMKFSLSILLLFSCGLCLAAELPSLMIASSVSKSYPIDNTQSDVLVCEKGLSLMKMVLAFLLFLRAYSYPPSFIVCHRVYNHFFCSFPSLTLLVWPTMICFLVVGFSDHQGCNGWLHWYHNLYWPWKCQ